MNQEILIDTLSSLDAFAKTFCKRYLQKPRVVAFYGEVGVGKTTFIKLLCEKLGVHEATSSPSFSIINQYLSNRGNVYHIDLYRLEQEEEAWHLGLEELFYSQSYCFIEWPDKVEACLPTNTLFIQIQVNYKNERVFKIRS